MFLLAAIIFNMSGCALNHGLICDHTSQSRIEIQERSRAFLTARGEQADWDRIVSESFYFEGNYVSYLVFFGAPPVGYLYINLDCDGVVIKSTVNKWDRMD